MGLQGKGVLAIWNGIAPEAEEDFVAWHVREHIPERVGLPGFLRGRRYVALDGFPKYFNFYETTTADDLSSAAYRARLNAPTEWTRRVVAQFRDTSRTICDVAVSLGAGDGGAVEALRLSTDLQAQAFADRMGRLMAQLLETPGIVAAHLLQGRPDASGGVTAEKTLRGQPDQIAEWILLIEAVGSDYLFALRSRDASDAAFIAAGAAPTIVRGCYQLQFDLSKAALARADG
jgi:hypothetical protein